MNFRRLRRLFRPAPWPDLRVTVPLSRVFGLDRGKPVDRYYIERFLDGHRARIQGRLLEVADSTYTRQFGPPTSTFEVLHVDRSNPAATMIGDLAMPETLPAGTIDCFVCTQTFHVVYDFRAAIRGAHHVLAPGGVLLATLPGISQISRYDMDRWGDFWRFTTASAQRAFEEVFGPGNVEVQCWGNVLAAVGFLHGLAVEDLQTAELDHHDPDYQLLITVRATKAPTPMDSPRNSLPE